MEEARSNDGRMKINGKMPRLGIMFSSTFATFRDFGAVPLSAVRAVMAGESSTQIRFHGRLRCRILA
jgi:hypothetical protein